MFLRIPAQRGGDHMAATVNNKTGAMAAALLTGALAICVPTQMALAQDLPPPPAADAQPPPPPAPVEAPPPVVVAPPPAAPAATVTAAAENKVQHKKMDPPGIWFRLDNRFR